MLKKIILTGAVALTFVSSLAFAADPAMTGKTDKGQVLTDHKGMLLYTWTKDTKAGDTIGDGFKDMCKVARP